MSSLCSPAHRTGVSFLRGCRTSTRSCGQLTQVLLALAAADAQHGVSRSHQESRQIDFNAEMQMMISTLLSTPQKKVTLAAGHCPVDDRPQGS